MRNSTVSSTLIDSTRPAAIAGTVCLFVLSASMQAHADVNAFTLRQPLNSATVRETVPIRVPRNLLAQAGYASVTIDGQFRGAQAIPDAGDVVYEWDTKHVAATSGAGGGDTQESPDGKHVVQVILFDKDSNEIASATSTVRVLNRITTLPDGVRLTYKWHPDEIVTYRLHSVLKNAGSDNSASGSPSGAATPAIQDVYARLQRSVEDVSGDGVLVRDQYVGGTYGTTPLTRAFTLSSKYTTVNSSGSVLVENQPLGSGRHYGYGFDAFPDRRVNAGDSWQTQMMVSLPWASEKMTTVRGQARLDEFEWENGYPTAKVVETYTGPATFRLDSGSQGASEGSQGLGSGANSSSDNRVEASNVTLKRTLWFAYEAGAVVREETSLIVNTSGLSGALSSLTSPSTSGASEGGTEMGVPRGRGGYGRSIGAPGYNPSYGGGSGEPDSLGSPDSSGSSVNPSQTNLESDKLLTLLSLG